MKPKTYRKIRKQIIKKLKGVSWNENSKGSLNMQFASLRRLFYELFEKEESKETVEEREKKILGQAVLIMKRIYFDSDVTGVFIRDMNNPLKDMAKTSDFFEFIGKLLRK